MTSTARNPVRIIGLTGIIAGLAMIVIGGVTWGVVASQLNEQHITVSEDASFMAGATVRDPFSAFAQAQVINKHALASTDGKTYAELGKDDPLRNTAQQASVLRASLFTSVVAFGVAALVTGLGVLVAGNGYALVRISARVSAEERTPASV